MVRRRASADAGAPLRHRADAHRSFNTKNTEGTKDTEGKRGREKNEKGETLFASPLLIDLFVLFVFSVFFVVNRPPQFTAAAYSTPSNFLVSFTMSCAVRPHILSISSGVFALLGIRVTCICLRRNASPLSVRASAIAEPRPPP